MRSSRGSGGEYRRFNPYEPQESSSVVLTDLFRERENFLRALETDADPAFDGAEEKIDPSEEARSPNGSPILLAE